MSNPVFSRTPEFSGRGGYAGFDAPSSDRTAPGQMPSNPYGQQPNPYAQPAPHDPRVLDEMYAAPAATTADTGRMTYDDVVVKTGIMFAVLLATAVVGWMAPALALPGALIGLVLGLVNSFKKNPSPPLMLAYAAAEGLFVGGLSAILSAQFPGIAAQAVMATLAVFVVALWAFKSGKVRVTPKSQKIFMIALGGYVIFSLLNFALSFFVSSDSMFGPLRPDGPVGFLIGLFAVGLASYMLVMDFDFVDRGVKQGLPAKFAWTAAFGLVVTLVWLYIEMLRLIAILRGDD